MSTSNHVLNHLRAAVARGDRSVVFWTRAGGRLRVDYDGPGPKRLTVGEAHGLGVARIEVADDELREIAMLFEALATMAL